MIRKIHGILFRYELSIYCWYAIYEFSIDKLVKNLSDEDFKYLVKEFGSEYLGLLKQKGANPYEYMSSFKRFN